MQSTLYRILRERRHTVPRYRGVIYSRIGIYAEVSAVAVERTVITLLGFLYHTLADIYSISTFLVTCGCGPDHCSGAEHRLYPGGYRDPQHC